jgi:AcrR family transcriptional regulator
MTVAANGTGLNGRESDDGAGVRERTLAAAIEEFAAAGFHRTSLRAVSERAGTNKPMVYYHFPGKNGLYLAAVRALLEETADQVRVATADSAPALTKLRRFAEVFLEAFIVSRPLLGTTLRELEALDAGLRQRIIEDYVRLVGARLCEILVEGTARGEFRRLDVDDCMGSITSILIGYLRFHPNPGEDTAEDVIDQLMNYYAVGLLSDAALGERLARKSQVPSPKSKVES